MSSPPRSTASLAKFVDRLPIPPVVRRREVAGRHAAAAAAHAGQLADELAAANRKLDAVNAEAQQLRREHQNLATERVEAVHRAEAVEAKLKATARELENERRTTATLREQADEARSGIAIVLATADAASARAQAAEDRLNQLLAGMAHLQTTAVREDEPAEP